MPTKNPYLKTIFNSIQLNLTLSRPKIKDLETRWKYVDIEEC